MEMQRLLSKIITSKGRPDEMLNAVGWDTFWLKWRCAGKLASRQSARWSWVGAETWAWTTHRKQLRCFWEITLSAAYYCPSQRKTSMCNLWNKHRGTKGCRHSFVSRPFSLYITETIRAQDNSYASEEEFLTWYNGILQSKHIWRTKRPCMPWNTVFIL